VSNPAHDQNRLTNPGVVEERISAACRKSSDNAAPAIFVAVFSMA
jgi:hypothetical protein